MDFDLLSTNFFWLFQTNSFLFLKIRRESIPTNELGIIFILRYIYLKYNFNINPPNPHPPPPRPPPLHSNPLSLLSFPTRGLMRGWGEGAALWRGVISALWIWWEGRGGKSVALLCTWPSFVLKQNTKQVSAWPNWWWALGTDTRSGSVGEAVKGLYDSFLNLCLPFF